MARAAPRNPPSWVLVSSNSAIAACPVSGRNAESGVGTGENVLVSCIIIPTTIRRVAMPLPLVGAGAARADWLLHRVQGTGARSQWQCLETAVPCGAGREAAGPA